MGEKWEMIGGWEWPIEKCVGVTPLAMVMEIAKNEKWCGEENEERKKTNNNKMKKDWVELCGRKNKLR